MDKINQTATIINGVVLTTEAIGVLDQWQEQSNERLREHGEALADAICFMAKTKHHWADGGFASEADELIQSLSYLRDELKEIRKP